MRRAHAGVVAAVALASAVWVGTGWGSGELTRQGEDAAAAAEEAQTRHTASAEGHPGNELGGEPSPYLQLHAENPVAWKPWGAEAFRLAKERQKPIFLSVGYSTCFWCHVMERKVFSDPEIAALMNEHFVNVKVDREERPDVDEVYMTATRVMTRSGGWPNSVFLTPEGKPFFAGTYFPPEFGHGRPGFPRVLRELSKAWEEDREKVRSTAERAAQAVRRASDLTGGGSVPAPDALLADARKALRERYEPEHGGFSPRTKFPRPPTLDLLMEMLRAEPDPDTREMLHRTLEEMALGGVYDHLAGGFHRYSTEATWSIPHFEKMLYDNAQLLGVYARAYARSERPLYRRVVEDVGRYLEREMRHPGGGYYSAQDAQVDGVEGASYIWTRAEVEEVFGEEATERFLSVYALVPMPEHAEGSPEGGVLRVQLPVREALERTGAEDVPALLARFEQERAKLLAARNERPQPLRDEKVLAGWNGLAIRGLVEAADALGKGVYLERAEGAAGFVLERLLDEEGRLHRSYIAGRAREAGVLSDYAYLADGLLALHGATGEDRWLRLGRSLADSMLARFEDPENGGFFLTADDTDLFVRPKPFQGGVRPSGNAVAVRVLRTLAARTGEKRYAEAAKRTLGAAGRVLARAPSSAAALIAAAHGEPGTAPGGSLVAASEEAGRETAPASSGTGSSHFDLPRSEDHVRVRAEWDPEASRTVHVRMEIDEGWHVNANPASLPFLEPTELRGEGGIAAWPEADVDYPEGERFAPEFTEETLSVYEGELTFTARLGEEAERPSAVALRYQACELARCLPPSTSRVELAEPEAR